ncbi:beta/gamma crystallin-related protein [uncultured Maribacter sp.]|uniref:beta/gamma crystallin-related protein n=1 Tax=uncultured Maribacter sp. TaxID=431308 RepID=UPI00260713BD|nr:beta/gamma crystallin-related protein [uncultured Maribacter sp.]
MRTSFIPQKKSWLLLLLPLAFLSFKAVIYFQPGLDSIQAITPFMNGNLPNSKPSEDIDLVEIHTNIEWESPQAILPFPETNKLLIVEMDGRFYTIPDNDNAQTTERTLVMDIQDRCWYYTYSGNTGQKHGGFQNVIFHPDFGKSLGKDYIYVYYVHKTENEDSDWTEPYYDRLSRFTWTGTTFDPSSELIMINQYDTAKGHDGSGLAFDGDGFLYVSVGDEGTHSVEATPHTQLLNDRFRSGVWRIDVDMQGGTISHPIERQPDNSNTPVNLDQSYTQGYYIPNDNPWVTGTGEFLEEFYAIGLRQPFRMTYDPPTGNFWLGDVGASKWEEVNIMDQPGLNFQWNIKEGFVDGYRNSTNMPNPLYGTEREPLYAYDGSVGSAVIGGYVYRGTAIPSLYGKYIFGDNANGSVYALTHTGGNTYGQVDVISNVGGSVFNGISSLGYNHDNEIIVLKLSNGVAGGGKIFKIVNNSNTENESLPKLLSDTGIFSDLQNLTPTTGVIPYGVNNPLWSSGTEKQRWVSIPQDGNVNSTIEQIGYNEEGHWTFPIGTTFIKQFNNTNGTKLETRLWIHGEDGEWFGSTYKWRSNGLEADLLLLGDNENITIDGDTFGYEYPASNTCIQCHNPTAGWVLGFNTRQLNKEILYPYTGRTSNQLETLTALGFIPEVDLENVPTLVSIDDNNQSLEVRARSYFDSNCAYCHLPGNTRASFDLRFSTPLSEQALIQGDIIEDLTGSNKAIVPGEVTQSNVHFRLNSLDLSTMMPPLAKGRVDTEAIQLVEAWINSLNGNCNEENTALLGSDNLTDGNFLDAHSPHINVSRTGSYTNNEDISVSICLENFNFYGSRLGNPVTPFIVKVLGENDFKVVSIGQTRTPSEYGIGNNTFNFSDHSNDAVILQPGESIAPGFMDAYPDGSGSTTDNSLIPAITSGSTDDIWQSYEANANSNPHLVMGYIPQGNSIVPHLNRTYQFNIEMNINAINGELAVPVLTLFQHADYNGTSWELSEGNYPVITYENIPNNDASSLQIDEGYIVELYSEIDYEGEVVVLDGNSNFLGHYDFNDKLSSIKIYPSEISSEPIVATFYQNNNYAGDSWPLQEGEYPDISTEGITLNEVSSVQVEEGFSVELYPELNFGGTPVILSSDSENLTSLGIDNDTESIKIIVIEPELDVVATLFQNVNYTGTSWAMEAGEYTDLTLQGISDNDASSVQILEGYVIELFSEKDFDGDVFVLEQNGPNLVSTGFNDQASSVKIYQSVVPSGPTVATFYEDSDYSGNSWELEEGEYADISLQDLTMNAISSVQVEEGFSVELYPELNFGGTPVILSSDSENLTSLGIDNDTESIKIIVFEPELDVIATLFQNVNYTGTSWAMEEGEYTDLTLQGISDNDASSVQILEGYVIELFSEKDFDGDVFVLEQNGPNLVSTGFNDQASSVKIYQSVVPSGPTVATFYEDSDYSGNSWELEEGEYADISLQDLTMNAISSVQVEEGFSVELYPELNFGGTPVILSSDSENLTSLGIDNDTESIKIIVFEPELDVVATLFQNVNYTGTSWAMEEGEYPDLTLQGISDNDASSVQILDGYVIELFSEKDFGGDVFVLEQNGPNLVSTGFNDQASSVKIYQSEVPLGTTVVTLFQNTNYSGSAWQLSAGNYPDISLQGINDNDASSIQIEIGYTIELYSEKNFEGDVFIMETNNTNLVAAGFDDRTSSVKIYESIVTTDPVIATLFQNINYTGTSWEMGAGEYRDITIQGINNNDASSIQIIEGYIIELYSEKDFGGDVFILEENGPNLVSTGFNDQTSSVKIYQSSETTGPAVATLFQNTGYNGSSWQLAVGDYPDISLQGINDNDASSVQIEVGYMIELFSEKDFGGEVFIIEENNISLVASGFDDRASSVKVYQSTIPTEQKVATLFQNVNYGGILWEMGVGDYADLTLEGINDNDASSVQIEDGYTIELYSEKDFGGDVLILEENGPNLVSSGFNDQASSVKIYQSSETTGPVIVTFFQNMGYTGSSWLLNTGNYPNISLEGILPNDIGSAQIEDGFIVELYPELDFGGTPFILSSNTIDLLSYANYDDTESVKIFANNSNICDCQCASGELSLLINGSFEETSNPAYASAYDLIEDLGIVNNGVKFLDTHTDDDFPGWFTTGGIALQQGGISQGGSFELGQSGFLGRIAPDGDVFVEMDANHHNQIVSVTPGQLLDWELSHQGREGTDIISISAGPIGNQTVIATVSSSQSWVVHSGQYQVPNGVSEIQFTITPVQASDGDIDSSNLLDFVKLCPNNGITNKSTALKAKIVENYQLSLYPNPVDELLVIHSNISNISNAENQEVFIYSANGLLVKHLEIDFKNSKEVEIYVDELSSGIYTIIIENNTIKTTAIRMIKN